MLAAGVPDGRPATRPDELERLLDDDRIWNRVTPEEADAAVGARARLRQTMAAVRAAAGRLEAIGVAAAVQHDDLHGGNIMVGPDGDRFFDWGDAVVAHPFSTLNVTFNSIAHHTGRALGDPAFVRLTDVYLEAWAGVAPRDALIEAAALARDLGCIGRSLAWERALGDLPEDDMDGHGDVVAGWLMEFVERLDGPSWGRLERSTR
jgi:aminoglycoside phosphotransferase (APT) family kinase protein